MSRVAVTGATGVLGRYTVPALRAAGHDVVTLGRPGGGADVGTDYSLESLAEALAGATCCLHLAGVRGGAGSFADFVPNVDMAAAVMDAAQAAGVGRVVLASSISVYSDANERPWRENCDPVPVNTYGVSKLAMEKVGERRGYVTGIEVCSLRLGHLYGALEQNTYMVNRFLAQAAAGEELRVTPPSDRTREMVYAQDAADACVLAVAAGVTGAVNVPGAEPLSNHGIAQAIVGGTPTGARVSVDEALTDTTSPTRMDGGRAENELGYRPRWTMQQAAADIYERVQEASRAV